MNVTRDELAHAWVADMKVDPSPGALAIAHRRISALGRLAEIRALTHVGAIVRVETFEHGAGPPYMAPATVHALVKVRAASDMAWKSPAG